MSGSIRKLPSGRYQARWTDSAGRRITAPVTFTTKRQATSWLVEQEADRLRGVVRDHDGGRRLFGDFASEWIDNGGSRGRLAPRTEALYRDLLARDLIDLHGTPLRSLQPSDVRRWYSTARTALKVRSKARSGSGDARLRQAYAFGKAVMNTAVRDGITPSNPFSIIGAGVASAPERPYMSPEVLAQIVESMPEHYRVPMHVMFGAHLRLGELAGLQRGDFDAEAGTLRVERQHVTLKGQLLITATKTGQARTVTLPPSTRALLSAHLHGTNGSATEPIFIDRTGESSLRPNAVQQAWRKATKALGLSQFHVHDVRHASLTVAAQAGATTRELMARAGHRTTAAAMVYQHVAEERSAVLAEQIDVLSASRLGTNWARQPIEA